MIQELISAPNLVELKNDLHSLKGEVSPSEFHQLSEMFEYMVFNETARRQRWEDRLIDPRRDIDAECGYPSEILLEDYKKYYERDAIGARVVEVLPSESWVTQPCVYEDEDISTLTPFEEGIRSLPEQVEAEDNWYMDETGNIIWETLERADELSGVGHYGGILLGIDDGKPLDKPAVIFGRDAKLNKPKARLLFMEVYDECSAEISEIETNRNSPRYGRPKMYTLKFNINESEENIAGGIRYMQETAQVHWTRFLHIADGTKGSSVIGVPRQKPVFNNILNIYKLSGGSAEMYWQGALPGLAFETHPQLAGTNVRIDETKARQGIEKFFNGLQRYLIGNQMQIKSLAPQVVDPTPQINAQIDLLCLKLGIPKRVFMGSERGELASVQDAETWNKRLMRRQTQYLTPKVVVPFFNRLIALGVLPAPKESYHVAWPMMETLNAVQKADVAFKAVQAMTMWIQGDGEALMHPEDFMSKIMQIPEEESMKIIEKANAITPASRMTTDPAEMKKSLGDPNSLGNPRNNGNSLSGKSGKAAIAKSKGRPKA